MKAAVLYGKEDVRVEEITPAPLKSGEVRIGIEAALTCGTDLKVFKRGYHAKMIVPARLVRKNLLQLKPGTNFRDAALVEPLACVVQGIEDTRLRAGQQVLVLGAGPIGLMFVALSKH